MKQVQSHITITIVSVMAAALAVTASAWHLSTARNAPRCGDILKISKVSGAVFDSTACDISASEIGATHKVKYRISADGKTLTATESGTFRAFCLSDGGLTPTEERKPGQNMPESMRVNVGVFNHCSSLPSETRFYREGFFAKSQRISEKGRIRFEEIGQTTLLTPDFATDDALLVRICQEGSQSINDTTRFHSDDNSKFCLADSTVLIAENIDDAISADSLTYSETLMRWYAEGYRYPIVERRDYVVRRYGTPCDSVTAVFYYPPHTQEEDIQNDLENDSIRTDLKYGSLWIAPKGVSPRKGGNGSADTGEEANSDGLEATAIAEDRIAGGRPSAEVFPTEVTDHTTVVISVPDSREVAVILSGTNGKMFWGETHTVAQGELSIRVPTDALQRGEYIISVSAGDFRKSAIIIKK